MIVMTEAKDRGLPNAPAFPTETGGTGMTLREWLIGQALAGLMANPEVMDRNRFKDVVNEALRGRWIARVAIIHADAVLEHLGND